MKRCYGCGAEKELKDFPRHKGRYDGHNSLCKECFKIYRKKNKERIRLKQKEWKNNHRHYQSEYDRNRWIKEPWKIVLKNIKTRCNNQKREDYKYYGGRGIKCSITLDEIRLLWFRDKAYLLCKPSIDRKDNDGNYTFGNCRFIEHSENSKLSHSN
jgi:hypothetical protein